ncbi:MAG: proprotein convertase P-domain-containing protein [Verrucomicrobia bacterium]|nr:proprotein convertase P-domain-containing protein [Verrucomicrobiota bacterium]
MKSIIPGILFLALPATAFGGGSAITLTQSWSGTLAIPDNSGVGASNTVTITAPILDRIESVTVAIELEGGWNGDLYAYLVHDGTLAILLNRPGRTALDDLGSGSANLIALFDDLAAGDVHMLLPGSGNATGTWQPDGRNIDPLLALDTTPRTKMLDGFTNANPNGDWTLFIADQNPGDTATLKSWTLSVTAVPETSTAMLGGMVALLALRRRRG